MVKRKYKELLRMRQNQELMFFHLIGYFTEQGYTVRDVIKATHIPEKRAWYILCKWNRKGWYNYGVVLDLGWLEIRVMPLITV